MGNRDDIEFDPTEFVSIADAPVTREDTKLHFELGPGVMVGDYRVEGKIGEGAMGVVFSAVHPLIGKRAAIKVLQRDLCSDRTSMARFVDEARVVNRIGHPNIVDIFALGQLPDGRSYLIMEWLQGETLRKRIERAIDLPETIHILRSLARALDAAHDKGVVHRDLKPDNAFLVGVRNDKPLVKLLDFGIAKLVHADQRTDRTASNQLIGTPLYIAPEQARNENIGPGVDIYALGAIAHEMLTGAPPFMGTTAMDVVAKHIYEPAMRPSERATGIPTALDDCVIAMLAKEPDHRPTLADFQAVLDHIERGGAANATIVRNMSVGQRLAVTRPRYQAAPPSVVASAVMSVDQSQAMLPTAATYSTVPPMVAQSVGPAASFGGPPPAFAQSVNQAQPVRRRWPIVAGLGVIALGVAIGFAVVRGTDHNPEERPAVTEPPPVPPAKADPPAGSATVVEKKPGVADEKPVVADEKPADPTPVVDEKQVDPKPVVDEKPVVVSKPAAEKPRPKRKKPDAPVKPVDDDTILQPGSVPRETK